MAENRELALVLKLIADQFQAEMKKSHGLTSDFATFLTSWKTQLAAVGTTLFAVAKSTANYGDELVKASQRLGTTVEDTARLQHAARLSDTDLQGLSATIGFLSKEMVQAASGNAEAQQKFDLLGLSVRNSAGQLKSTTEILLELNDKFRQMPDGPEKTGRAMLVMGKSAKEVLPFLNSDLREAFTEAEKLGLVMSEKDARAAEHFNDELTKLQGAIRGVTNDIGSALIPKFDAMTHALTTIITDAHAAAAAILAIPKVAPSEQTVTVQPPDGKKRLRVVPAPSKAEQQAFAPEPSGFVEKAQQDIGKALVAQFISEEKIKESLRNQEEAKGKALLEIYLAQNRAIDIGNKLRTEGADGYRLAIDRQLQFEQEDQAYQERQGRLIVEQTGLQVRIQEQAARSERAALIENAQAWVAYYDQVGGSSEGRYQREMDLLRAHLAQQTQLTQEEAGRLLIAWEDHQDELARLILNRTTLTAQERETLELQALAQLAQAHERVSDDIFSGWARGMERYVQDTKSGFGLAADLARRTAQAMEQGFRNFFFDLFDGKIKTLKDALKGVLDFVKQIAAQIAAQIAVKGVLSGFGFGANLGGELVQRFATGGPVMGTGNRDTVAALLTPGEYVLSRQDVSAIKNGIVQANRQAPAITVNVLNAPPGTSAQVQTRQDVDSVVIDVLLRHRRDLGLAFGGA